MEIFQIKHLSFTYPNRARPTLSDLTLTIETGAFVLICGKSGCGKTTLLRALKPSLAPNGVLEGALLFRGAPIAELSARDEASTIGFVQQNPESQIVTDKVWHELAFGLESLGYPTKEIRARVSETASFFGIQDWFYQDTAHLSGGQKQLLALASAMVMQPDVLIVDEPTAQLDPIAASEFLKTLKKINDELGTTIILTEHRLEDAFPLADRVLVMEEGEIIADGSPLKIGAILKSCESDMYFALPTPMRVHAAVASSLSCPLTVRDGRCWLHDFAKNHALTPEKIPTEPNYVPTSTAIELKEAWFRYEKDSRDVVKGLSLRVEKGEIFALVGGNGVGKSTALSLIAKMRKPYRGDVTIHAERVGFLPQNPQTLFLKNTIYRDLMEVANTDAQVQEVSCLCQIDSLLNAHPYDLSGGEQQRAALAKVLLTQPDILLLDEPTKGMDARFKTEFAKLLTDLKENGMTIVMVSHDIEFCAEYADRCALMFDGAITALGTPREFFAGKHFYTTSANRMARTLLPNAVLAQDIILACGGTPHTPAPPSRKQTQNHIIDAPEETENRKSMSGKSLLVTLSTLLVMALTIFLGNTFLGARKYYITALLILLETMLPFFVMFERKKPKARDLVVISVLCAIAVAGRAVFFMLPQFKPVVAVVIIAGVALGGEVGFLVGAMSGFLSNFFFGQGPWAPWQMVALGTIGFLAGVFFRSFHLPKKRIPLAVFGFFATLLIYGGIMNPASVILAQDHITQEMIATAYSTGLPFDLIHASATVFFLWVLANAMLEKLDRAKAKFGLL